MSDLAFSNKEDWTERFEVYDYETGEVINKSLVANIKIELEDPKSKTPELQGSLATGEIVEECEDQAIYSWRFPYTQTSKLLQQVYDFAAILDDTEGGRVQLWRTKVTVGDGIVNE